MTDRKYTQTDYEADREYKRKELARRIRGFEKGIEILKSTPIEPDISHVIAHMELELAELRRRK